MSDNFKVTESNIKIDVDWCTIFSSYSFFEIHKTEASSYFTLTNNSSNELVGICHFSSSDQSTFRSPFRGTFAGFELKKFDSQLLQFFIREVELFLLKKGAKQIIVNSAPFIHNLPIQSHMFNSFLNDGYKIYSHEINHSIYLKEIDLVSSMQKSARKRYNKCMRDGFTFRQVTTKSEIQNVYNIIAVNRESKGYSISMSFDQIMRMQEAFPLNLYFFETSHHRELVASGICIKLSHEILYVFYWGDLPGYEQHSPIIFLASGIYEFARKNGFKILDIGTSTQNGIPNQGLIKFKENLGFMASLKLAYSKNLD